MIELEGMRFLTFAEAAEWAGVKEPTIRSWVHRKHLRTIDLKQFGGVGKVVRQSDLSRAEGKTRQRDDTGRAKRRSA